METNIEVRYFADPVTFKDQVFPFLLKHEAEHCLVIGIVSTLIANPAVFPDFHLMAAFQDGEVVGAAWMTPPHPFGFSMMSRSVASALFTACRFKDIVKHIFAPTDIAGHIVSLFGRKVVDKKEQRIFKLKTLEKPGSMKGSMRTFYESDIPYLLSWERQFYSDCGMPKPSDSEILKTFKRVAADKSKYLLEVDGEIVCMTSSVGKTPHGIRVGYVYTPKEFRGNGYASTLVAMVTEKLLDEGNRFCFLFTDLANPTSNSIYQKLGYKPVLDVQMVTFTATGLPHD